VDPKIILVIVIGIVLLGGVFALSQKISQPSISSNLSVNSPLPTSSQTQAPITTPSSTSSKPTVIASAKVEITTNKTSGETTVEVTETALNDQLKASLVGQSLGSTPLGEATITDVKVTINEGYLLISGTAKNGFLTPPFQAKSTLNLVDNKAKLSISELTLNGVTLPRVITDQLEGTLQSKVDALIGAYNFKLKSITLVQGKIVIVGTK
jgi:hypothetical protein